MEQAYKELLKKYNSLLEENRRLKTELALLKGEDGLSMPESETATELSSSTINKYSSSKEKINLFRSLFKGREDVFARRWYSKTLDKNGYQPVCENEWNEEYCDKKKYKCSDCPNRKLMSLTDNDIYRHLSGKDLYGRDVVGIYPMLTDETCLFLCADFDEESFKADVSAFRKTCKEFNIPVSVEISRSGNGAHAWIFFSEPVSASLARKLGSGILTRTMETTNLSFKSYDRFFPNQDTMPKGGFGNLVALPLQGNARKNGNSVFVDECHHVSAVNFEKILKFANAKYVYGLTATPTRQDGHHPIIFMQCGPVRYKVDAKSQAEKRNFEHYLIPRFTPYRSETKDKNITEIYKDLSENELRNSYIVNDIIKALKSRRTPIVLTERREHVLKIKDMLNGYCKNIITLFGTSSQKERRETLEKLQAISDNENLIIIATGKYVGEGFDYPRLDTLFLALPIAWKGKVARYAGRLHRNYPGKNEVQIYDYVDIHIPVLERMYQKRLKGYSSIGYRIKIDNEHSVTPDLIYDGKSFYTVYCQDIKSAHKEVLIVCPFMRKNRIFQLSRTLIQAKQNGVSMTVITRPPEDFKESERNIVKDNTALLQSYGVNVIYKSDFHQKFTVIDNKIVWYGSVNFLSFGTNEESIMRFVSFDVAGELKDTVM